MSHQHFLCRSSWIRRFAVLQEKTKNSSVCLTSVNCIWARLEAMSRSLHRRMRRRGVSTNRRMRRSRDSDENWWRVPRMRRRHRLLRPFYRLGEINLANIEPWICFKKRFVLGILRDWFRAFFTAIYQIPRKVNIQGPDNWNVWCHI